MLRIQRFLIVSLTVMLALSGFGCGSDTDDFMFTGDTNTALQGPATFAGRFNLGGFSPTGATIEVQSLDGQILARTETDVAGNYFFHDFRAPADFRVVARIGQGAEFASEVRGYSSDGKVTGMNVATSLASAYLRIHPGESLESAEDRVRRGLHFSHWRLLGCARAQRFMGQTYCLEHFRRADPPCL